MNFERKLKKCGIWMACAYKAEKGVIGIEEASERRELYQYVYYGSAKIGKPFTDKCRIIDNVGELVDVKEFFNQDTIFDFTEDTSMWGFNVLSKNINEDWDGRLITEDKITVSGTSILVCLDGKPVVNNIELRKFDYDELTVDKNYNIILNNGVLALFTKL